MHQRVFLIHGWSVQETTTYQALHKKLADHGFDLEEIYPGRYISLENEVEVRDIARALQLALSDVLKRDWTTPFHIITHSTGALIAKQWIASHYKGRFAAKKPLHNIVFLAGPHFGSRLAHHGRSMLAQAAYRGDTGRQVLQALELGSGHSWQMNRQWLDPETWRGKGIRPFGLTGDRVIRKAFQSRIFPAAYEPGSDMVVRAAAGNLNFRRFELKAGNLALKPAGAIRNIPFAALADYTHSGARCGIMNSITSRSTRRNHLGLRLILECLEVKTAADYRRVGHLLEKERRKTRTRRPGHAQLDLRFRDEDGEPIDDYALKIGYIVAGRRKASKIVAHTHKNAIQPSHFTVFLRMKELDPRYAYFIEADTRSDSDLFHYAPDPFPVEVPVQRITELIVEDQTTQIEMVLAREPSRKLFRFHAGGDPALHVRWDRAGEITKTGLKHE
jgi:hypothetical protein